MATSVLDVGYRIARQALVEKPEYVANDDDLDASFFPNGGPTASPTPTAAAQAPSAHNILSGWRNLETANGPPSPLPRWPLSRAAQKQFCP